MEEHQRAMEEVKEIMTNFPLRTHFDPKLPTIIETDAARKKGSGYALMQLRGEEYRIVEAGSRWLTPAEQNYGMTSLEPTGVYWAMEKCKPYWLGLPYFEVYTDHQPLVSILNMKTLDEIENPRQQSTKEKIQQRFNFKVKWQPGKKMYISDALSRAPVEEAPIVNEIEEHHFKVEKAIINAVETNDVDDVFGDQKLNNLLQEANADVDYVALRRLVRDGFPAKRQMVPERLRDFWTSRYEFSEFKGFILMNQQRIIIPTSARENVLKDLHAAHQGIVRMKRRARNTIYWPRIDEDIARLINAPHLLGGGIEVDGKGFGSTSTEIIDGKQIVDRRQLIDRKRALDFKTIIRSI